MRFRILPTQSHPSASMSRNHGPRNTTSVTTMGRQPGHGPRGPTGLPRCRRERHHRQQLLRYPCSDAAPWPRRISTFEVFEVDQRRHVTALMSNSQDYRRIACRRDPSEKDDMPPVVHRSQPRREQASVASTVRVGRNRFERTHQAAVVLQPLSAAPSIDRVASDFVEIPLRQAGQPDGHSGAATPGRLPARRWRDRIR